MIKRLFEGRRLQITPSTALEGGTLFVVSPLLVGVVPSNIDANRLGSIEIDGIFEFDKATGDGNDFDPGQEAYWDAANSRVTPDDDEGANARVGLTAAAASTSATRVPVLLNRS